MARATAPEPPTVVIVHVGQPDVIREVCAGIEEEGVPYSLQPLQEDPQAEVAAAVEMGMRAARQSRLDVGVGIDSAGRVAVHHEKLPLDRPVLDSGTEVDLDRARLLGHNAARVVTGIPFK